MSKVKKLYKPIFIVGHARGGTTLLGSIINTHSKVGPKYLDNNLDTDSFKNYKKHLEFSEKLEQKEIWFKYFKGEDCFTHMGKEIYENTLTLDEIQVNNLIEELTKDFKEDRFLSKAPTNSFRLNPIKDIFPESKIVVVLRKGEEVVASWGKRPYGFNKRVNWGSTNIKKLSYFKGINIFSKKWLEVIDAVESFKDKSNIFIVTYEDIIDNTDKTLHNIVDFLELPYEDYLKNVFLESNKNKWKKELPFFYRYYLKLKVKKGNSRILKLKTI